MTGWKLASKQSCSSLSFTVVFVIRPTNHHPHPTNSHCKEGRCDCAPTAFSLTKHPCFSLVFQVVELVDEVSDIEVDLEFIMSEQLLQDQQIYNLEQSTVQTQEDILSENTFLSRQQVGQRTEHTKNGQACVWNKWRSSALITLWASTLHPPPQWFLVLVTSKWSPGGNPSANHAQNMN